MKCQSLFWSAPSDPNTGFCPDGGNHDSDGLELRVPHTSVERTPMRQPDWRFLMKCFTLFFQWPPEKTRCPKDQGQHKPAGFNFQIPVIVGSVAGTEPYWRMCKKCRSMFFEDGQSRCPRGGGPHDAAESKFPLSSGLPETLERESDWRECRKCAGLFFDGFVDKGSCPSDGLGHEKVVFGANYSLEHNPGADDHNRDGFRYCVRCHGLVLADQPARVPWVAPVVVNTADHAVIPGNSGQALVMIGYDWKAFRLLYMPLFPGETPRLHHVRYYDAGLQQWSQEPTHDEKFKYALFKHRHADEDINYTHVSAAWLPDAGHWVVLYAASGGKDKPGRPIIARLSKDLTEWSDEVEVFDPLAQNAFGTFMHEAGQHDGIDRMPPRNGALDESGWAYGAFILEPFTRFDRESRQLRLVYLMSTSNPYQVHVMQTVLRLPRRSPCIVDEYDAHVADSHRIPRSERSLQHAGHATFDLGSLQRHLA